MDVLRRDTIFALATPPMASAIAVVRVSGQNALAVKEQIFFPKRKEQNLFVAMLGDIKGRELIDEAICVAYPEGKSYTGENAFELFLHGSPVIVKSVLRLLQESGCRAAEPGEFSMRAVLTGKIDLCQADAVCDLIGARSEEAAQIALRSLKGGLAAYLDPIRTNIVDVLCEIEARLDFPDEDLGNADRRRLAKKLAEDVAQLEKLLRGAQFGERLTQGARVVLFGKPNVGKSTLLNALLGEERALVHDAPGTTRDVLESTWLVRGIPVTLVDVAGVREAENIDPVEAMGIARARKELLRADAVIWLRSSDAMDDLSPEMAALQVPILEVLTKADLHMRADTGGATLWISAKTGYGLDRLIGKVANLLAAHIPEASEVLLTRVRQKEEVELTTKALIAASQALIEEQVDEIVASELRQAGKALDRLLGKSLNEDVLNLIFSRFCIGK